METLETDKTTDQQRSKPAIKGRIDEHGKVLLPIILIASDGLEIELDALVHLEFGGALVIPEDLAGSLGWRCLGARRVMVGMDVRLMHHYLGLMSLGEWKPVNVVVLGGMRKTAIIGQKMLSGRKLTVDFASGVVELQ